MSGVRQFLVVRFSSLGDVVLTTPFLRAIKARFPDSELTFVTKSQHAPLLETNPNVDRIVVLERGQSIRTLSRRINTRRYDHRFDLHGSLRSRVLRLSVPGTWNSYNKKRLAKRALIWFSLNFFDDEIPVAERYFESADNLSIIPDKMPAEIYITKTDLEEARSLMGDATIAIAPGARHATKQWPVPHWMSLLRIAKSEKLKVVVVGLKNEVEPFESEGIMTLAELPIRTTAAVLKRSKMVIANDSGLMHVATAVGTPVIGLFGPTVGEFGFFPYANNATVIERQLSCRPCSSHGGARCPLNHHRCMKEITPEAVFSAIEAA